MQFINDPNAIRQLENLISETNRLYEISGSSSFLATRFKLRAELPEYIRFQNEVLHYFDIKYPDDPFIRKKLSGYWRLTERDIPPPFLSFNRYTFFMDILIVISLIGIVIAGVWIYREVGSLHSKFQRAASIYASIEFVIKDPNVYKK